MARSEQTGDLRVDQIMPEVCPSWFKMPFEECLHHVIGRFKKLKKKNIKPNGRIPVVDQGETFVSGYIDNEADAYEGSLPVIIFGDHTRRIKFIDFPFAVGADGTKILKPIEYFDPKFFYFYMRSLNLESQGYSRHYRFLKQTKVPVPSHSEQHRIVAKLEKLLAKVDACKDRLEKIPAILKRFRQSVLAAAFGGTLTSAWRFSNPDIAPATDLLKKIGVVRLSRATTTKERNRLQERHHSQEEKLENTLSEPLPNTWTECTIGSIGDVQNGSTPSRKNPGYWNGKLPWVSSGEVRNNEISATREQISEEGFKNSSVRWLPPGTVLLAMIGEGKTRGQSAVLRIKATINQNIAAIVIDHGLILPEYLWYWFQYQYSLTRLIGSGSGPKALNCQRVRYMPFNLAPTEEQHEIVRRVEALLKIADDIEKRYQKAKAHVDKLTQSILAKAFRGELVPQDPNDEPAAELLKRIQAERKNQEAETRPGRKSTRRRVKN